MKTIFRIAFVLFLSLGGTLSSQAQSVFHDWYRHAPPPTISLGYIVLEPSPDIYWVVSQVRPFNTQLTYFQVVQFEQGKEPFEQITYDPFTTEFMGGACFSQDKQHLYIAYGRTYDVDANTEGWVAKLDLNGNVIWETQIREYSNTFLRTIEIDADGNVLIAGSGIDGNVGGFFPYILKLSATGDILWSKSLPDARLGIITGIFVANEETYLFGAIGHPDIPSYDPLQMVVLDPSGEIKRQIFIEDQDLYFKNGIVDEQGNIYGMVPRASKVYKVSPSGNIVWKHPIQVASTLRFAPDGNVLIGGNNYLETYCQIKKITPNSVLIYDRRFDFGNRIGIENLLLTKDGGIAVTGAEGGPSGSLNETNAYLVKLNCQAELNPDFSSCNKTLDPDPPTVYNLQVTSDLLSPYPLGSAFGESAVIHLYDLIGRELRSWGGSTAPSQGLDLTGLTNGWYLYRLESGTKTPQTGKIQLLR